MSEHERDEVHVSSPGRGERVPPRAKRAWQRGLSILRCETLPRTLVTTTSLQDRSVQGQREGGVIQSRGHRAGSFQKVEEPRKEILLSEAPAKQPCPHLDVRHDSWNCKAMHLCCFSHCVCANLSESQQEAKTLPTAVPSDSPADRGQERHQPRGLPEPSPRPLWARPPARGRPGTGRPLPCRGREAASRPLSLAPVGQRQRLLPQDKG